MYKPTILYISDIPFWGGSTLSLKDMINSLGDRVTPIVLIQSRGEVYTGMTKLGVECIVLPYPDVSFKTYGMTFYLFWLYYTIRYFIKRRIFLNKIETVLKGRKIDIVHTNTSIIDIGCDVAKILNCQHVWHIREMLDTFNYIQFVDGGLNKLKEKMSTADGLIFISSACCSHWNINGSLERQIVIGDAIRSKKDTKFVEFKKKYFLFCSVWLSDFKGTDVAIKAFAGSGLANQGYRLKLIGKYKKKYKQRLDKLSRQLNIDRSVDYLGLVDIEDVYSYMVEATAFLQCSKIEGLGRTTIEAMFYGCPVIARNCGGSLDFVEHGKTGFLWSSIEDISLYMKQVATNDMTDIIVNAQNIVTSLYNKEDYGDKIFKVYQKL